METDRAAWTARPENLTDQLPGGDSPREAAGEREIARRRHLTQVGVALRHVAAAQTMSRLIDQVTTEICLTCGFDRAFLWRVKDRGLVLESGHSVADSESMGRLVDYWRA